MDRCTHEVRLQHWKNIISQCQARPTGQTAKQWMEENGICEQSYYSWQRRIRQDAYDQMTQEGLLPVPVENDDISFAEISLESKKFQPTLSQSTEFSIHSVAVIKAGHFSVAISNDISEMLLSRILKEATHA